MPELLECCHAERILWMDFVRRQIDVAQEMQVAAEPQRTSDRLANDRYEVAGMYAECWTRLLREMELFEQRGLHA